MGCPPIINRPVERDQDPWLKVEEDNMAKLGSIESVLRVGSIYEWMVMPWRIRTT